MLASVLCALVRDVGGAGLEATLIAVDNSGHMINSDHRPSRLQSQYEGVNLVCTVKTQNPENTVGLMAMGCQTDQDCPRVLVTPATNQMIGPILIAMSKVNDQIGGHGPNRVRFEKAMRTAYLSLKHRVNKNQRPRIVAFVGSPLAGEDKSELVKWGKRLRKNNVAVDIISFGESPRVNTDLLQAFIDAVDKDGTSHLLSLPPESCPAGGLSDALFSSPVLIDGSPPGGGQAAAEGREESGAGARGSQGAFAEFGGVNPELDPELAMALKMSAEVFASVCAQVRRRACEHPKTRERVRIPAPSCTHTSVNRLVHAQEEQQRREKQKKRELEALARSAAASADGAGACGGGGGGGGDAARASRGQHEYDLGDEEVGPGLVYLRACPLSVLSIVYVVGRASVDAPLVPKQEMPASEVRARFGPGWRGEGGVVRVLGEG